MSRTRLAILAVSLMVHPPGVAGGEEPAGPPNELEIVYAGDAAFPPYEFLDASGKPAGLNVDLIRAVGIQQGLRVTIRLEPWSKVRRDLETGAVNVAAMYRTPRRAREVDFAISHELVYHELFVARGSPPLSSLGDLAGKRVLVEEGTFSAEAVQEMGSCIVLERPSEPEALRSLARGEGDVAIVTQAVGRPFHERSSLHREVVPTGPPVLLAEYAFVTQPGHRALLERLNQGVAAVKASGEYDRLYEKWLQPDRSAALVRSIGWALLAATLVALIAFGWSWSLRRRVARQTLALRREFEEKERAQAALAEAERSLRSAQKLEAVGRLAGAVAHDFNNVLSVLLSYGTSLREDLQSRGVETGDVDEILAASERAARLTRQLLAFSRATPVSAVRLELAALVGEMKSMLQRLVGEHIQVETAVPSRPVVVDAEPTQLEQILLNLAANARDAMPGGGHLSVKLEERTLGPADASGLPAGDYAEIVVADSGVGMPAETLARIFEPFFTTKEAGHGTGLGLATVLAHVQRLRGKVTVESVPGQGSTFHIVLPRSAHHEADAGAAAVTPLAGAAPTEILLVEDDDALRRAAALALERAGHRVLEAKDGEMALDVARCAQFSLVVTDVVMPRRGGPSLVAELRRERPRLKVLYVSGYVQDDQRLDLDVPGTAYLAKPYAAGALVEAVHALLSAKAA